MSELSQSTSLNHFAKASLAAAIIGLIVLSGCSTTEKAKVTTTSSFLGPDAAKLIPGGKDQAGLRYVNPAAQWSQYNKIMIAPVTLWGSDATKVSATDQQTLVNFFSQQLHQELAKHFQIVDQPGPGVLKLAVALTDAEAATPVLRSITMIVPQAHMISNLKYLATDSFPFVGAAQAEGKITDAVTGQTLAAMVDKRLGGGNFTTGFQWKWGDAENAITEWSKKISEKLAAWTSGQEKPQ